jgi:hypothetical protein
MSRSPFGTTSPPCAAFLPKDMFYIFQPGRSQEFPSNDIESTCSSRWGGELCKFDAFKRLHGIHGYAN